VKRICCRVALLFFLLALPDHFCVSRAGELPPGVGAAAAESGETVVLGLSFRGRHRAYPLKYFLPPRVINDWVREQEIAIFHDSDLGLSVAYFRMVIGELIEFSGDVRGGVADDLTTMTRWDLKTGKAVGGNLVGMELIPLPVLTSSRTDWFAAHPDTTVFSPESP
jgi:hypothetical protein